MDFGTCHWCKKPNTCAPYLVEIVGSQWDVCEVCYERWNARLTELLKAEFMKPEPWTEEQKKAFADGLDTLMQTIEKRKPESPE